MKGNIFSALSILCRAVKEHLQHAHNRYIQQQAVQQQNILQDCIYAMAGQMAIELYQSFHPHTYNLLQPLCSPSSIRFRHYRQQNGGYLYQFSMDKRTNDKIALCVLQEMQNKMNYDIASTQRELLSLYGYEYLYRIYPFLYYGIYITAIQDLNVTEVTLTVQTHLAPQDFLKLNR